MKLPPDSVGLRVGFANDYDIVRHVTILTPAGEITVGYRDDTPFDGGPEILIDGSLVDDLSLFAVLDGRGHVWHLALPEGYK